ncbi:MAG: tRNA 2-thiouridine(34) synthase MnmA [Candidatus Paceibacterota bacterium]
MTTKKSKKLNKTVFVGMSGGVDSSVSAALLKEEGYEVVGVFIKTWHPDFIECNEEEERRDAMRVAAYLDIPFLTFDFEDVYKKGVADYMINEYKAGRTPNPDVMCNREVKFGAFLNKAREMGADYVATGHYVQNINKKSFGKVLGSPIHNFKKVSAQPDHSQNYFYLRKSIDPTKDQSYFLWTLKQEQLKNILFPIGNLTKKQVRVLAKKFKLPVAAKKDSQGICFLGQVDLKDFLKHYIKAKNGNVLNTMGEVIGTHDGAVFYTLGERHGFNITKKTANDARYYVVDKDIKKNILVVSTDKDYSIKRNTGEDNTENKILLNNINWISKTPEENKNYTAQIRYHGEFLNCKIINDKKNKNQLEVVFEKPVKVASGQSVVFYDSELVLGGGVVV